MTNEEIIAAIAQQRSEIDMLKEKTDHIEALTLSVQKLAMSVEIMTKEQAQYRTIQDDVVKRIISIEHAPTKAAAEKHRKAMDITTTFFIGICSGVLIAVVGAAVKVALGL